jgi:hypothetical protein
MLQVVEPLAEDTVVAVPYAISGSVLMRAPLKTFDWIKPE